MTPRSKIARSLDRINSIADIYECGRDGNGGRYVTAIIVDLMHWCAAYRIDLAQASEFAIDNFLEELTEEEAVLTGHGSGDGPSGGVRRRRTTH
jgi:hypothetical protein